MDGAKGGVLYCGWRRERYKMLPWSAGLRSGEEDVCAVLHSVIIGADKTSFGRQSSIAPIMQHYVTQPWENFKERRKYLNQWNKRQCCDWFLAQVDCGVTEQAYGFLFQK
jgi:hypothetical protein